MTPWCSQHAHFYSPYQPYSYMMMITIFLLLTLPYSSSLEFDFQALDQHNRSLMTQGNTTYLPSLGIELTTNKSDQIGHVKYFEYMKLSEKDSDRVAGFTTSFSFIIYSSNQGAHGDGFAFFLAQPPFGIPNTTVGSRMGLIGEGDPISSARPFVAVEFDTFRNQRFDPQDFTEHVGINVNSMVSRKTTSWSCNITTWKVYNATVSYSSRTKNFSVSFTGYKGDVVVQQSLSDEINLAEYLPERVTFGFSAANGIYTSRHILRSWSFHSEELSTSTNSKTGLVVGLSVGACVFVGALGLIYFGLWKWKKKKSIEEEDEEEGSVFDLYMDNDFERGSGAKRFSYDELAVATKNFSEEEKLGQGGFGGVYRGLLNNMNSYVAIKKVSTVSAQGLKEYASEVKIISRLRHRNLVQLIGWCHRKKELLLVYEFMPNGSLDLHLFRGKSLLSWVARYNIARGLASALLYLHEEWEQCVLHRDIKSSNVMLDSNFNAKLGDFGLARLVDHEKGSQTTIVAGTLGYLAPECFTTCRASRESDVYSFGVVILEIACGRKSIDPKAREGDHQNVLVEWVWKLYGMESVLEAADPKLCREFDEQQMKRLMIVGLWCAHPDYNFRPSIKQAIHVLDFEAPLPLLPSEMPLPTYLPPSVVQSNGSTTSGSENTQTQSSTNTTNHFTSSSQFTSSFSH